MHELFQIHVWFLSESTIKKLLDVLLILIPLIAVHEATLRLIIKAFFYLLFFLSDLEFTTLAWAGVLIFSEGNVAKQDANIFSLNNTIAVEVISNIQ